MIRSGKTDYRAEQRRFMQVAYQRTLGAARKAFKAWHARKRDDAIQECLSKMWDSWIRLVDRGGDPEPILHGLIKHSVLWVRYDRRIAGRARMYDVYDYRAGMTRQDLDGQGKAHPSERSDRINGFLGWTPKARTDDPAGLAAALETAGVTLEQYLAA
jgi:hypothetical protein